MDKLLKYLPFHFLLALICGICIQYFINIWQYGFLKLALTNVLLLVSLLILHKLTKKILFTAFSWLLFVFVGISTVYIQDERNYNNYYEKFTSDTSVVTLSIKKVLKSSNYYYKYEADVTRVQNQSTSGKILLNIQKDSLLNMLQVEDQLLTSSRFVKVNPPLNPHQFSYKEYLARQGIHQQLFLEKNQFKVINTKDFSLVGLSAKIRESIQSALKKYNFSKDEFGVINALLLGQRQELSKELLQEYSRAGAIHILAVSGLHVGIILLLLLWILHPLNRLKKGNYLKTIIVVVLLWMFALIAGLSASVVRAVTMFTFVAVGKMLNRNNSVEHSLITSMFVLLILQPLFLFDVGFQLSYLAVFGIVWVQPKLYSLWKPKLKLLDKPWQLFTVSVGAQVGILPISLYYFHQFPSLFILSNLLIVPALGGILLGGILIIVLVLLNILPQELANLYGFVISKINQFVSWISHQEDFVFQQLSMSFLLMLAWYVVIILMYRFVFIRRKASQLIYLFIGIVALQSVYLFEKYKVQTSEEFIVFHKSRNSVIGNKVGEQLHLFSNLDSIKIHQENLLKSYLVGERLSGSVEKNKSNIFQFKSNSILVVDSLGVYKVQGLQNPMILLQYSPKINLKRLINDVKPIKIIADGTNYKSHIKRWKETCEQEKTPFHYTGENGAFILSD